VYTVSGAFTGALTLGDELAWGVIEFPLNPGLYILVAEADGERFLARLVVGAP
jgi:hypothetical protein